MLEKGLSAFFKHRKMKTRVRSKTLKLTTLEIRRKREDMIEFCKILNELDTVEWNKYLVKPCKENSDGPANNSRRKRGCAFTGRQLM